MHLASAQVASMTTLPHSVSLIPIAFFNMNMGQTHARGPPDKSSATFKHVALCT